MARTPGEKTAYPGIEQVPDPDSKSGFKYRARVDARSVGGGQSERAFPTLKEARAWQARVMTEVRAGTYVGKSTLTVAQAVAAWLEGTEVEAYTHDTKPLVAALGTRRVQSIAKRDVEKLIRALHSGVGSPRPTPWKSTTVNSALRVWKMIWADLVAQRVLDTDVVALVTGVPPEKDAYLDDADDADDTGSGGDTIDTARRLTDAEIRALLDAHDPDTVLALPQGATGRQRVTARATARRHAFLHLALLGLRRGELAGLRWSHIDGLDDVDGTATLTVQETRVPRRGGTKRRRRGKTSSATRTLLIPGDTAVALRRHRELQAADRRRVGDSGWKGGKDVAVLTVDSGKAAAPRTLDDWWHRSRTLAGVSHARLHDLRHTAASRLLDAQVPIRDLATWLGHADGGTLALRVYGHTDPANLHKAAEALGRP